MQASGEELPAEPKRTKYSFHVIRDPKAFAGVKNKEIQALLLKW